MKTKLSLQRLEARENPSTLPANFAETVLGEGVQASTALVVAPNGEVWATEQTGTVKRFRPNTFGLGITKTIADPVFSVTTDSTGERGLLGLAFDPGYNITNPFVYVYYTVPAGNGTPAFNRISRFTVDTADLNDYSAVANSEFVIANLDPLVATNHNGGDLGFGIDGKLYVSVGENNVAANSQSLSNRLGKVLRYNADGTIPSDNPVSFDGLAGTATGANRAIYAVGFRNPYRFAVQPVTGKIFVGDVGGGAFEEIDELRAGANYGWPQTEGFNPGNVAGVTYPVFVYSNGAGPLQGQSIVPGAFYPTGDSNYPPEFKGDFFYADFIAGRIYVRDTATGSVSTFADDIGLPSDMGVLPTGQIVYLDRLSGEIRAIGFAQPPSSTGPLSAVGSGRGIASQVTVKNSDGKVIYTLSPYGAFTGGVRVAVGDVTGDGNDDIVTAAGPGGGPHVKAFDGVTGKEVRSFFAYIPNFSGGVNVAVGDLDGDGTSEIITGAGAGGGPHVKAFDQAGNEIKSFFGYGSGFSGGVNVAAGDLDGDGQAEILTGAGPGGGPHVKAFRATDLAEVRSFFAYESSFNGGVNVAAGDTDGDGRDDIIAGASTGSRPVNVFRADSRISISPFGAFGGGTRVGFSNGVLWAGAGPGGGPHVKGFVGTALAERDSFFAFDPGFGGGVFVG